MLASHAISFPNETISELITDATYHIAQHCSNVENAQVICHALLVYFSVRD